MYITVTDDENKYYRTWTSGQTNIEGCKCILCDALPEIELDKQRFCKLHETTEITYKEITQYKYDEEGNIQYTEEETDDVGEIIKPSEPITEIIKIPHEKIIYSWLFDEDAYNNHIKELKEAEKQPSDYEKLRGDIDFLAMEIGVEL